jgi:hypothetical protein
LEVLDQDLHLGDAIWVRLTITNVGKEPVGIVEPLFNPRKDITTTLSDSIGLRRRVYLELTDASGTQIKFWPPFSDDVCTNPGRESAPWTHHVSTRGFAVPGSEKSTGESDSFGKWLKPGESIKTRAYMYRGSCPEPLPKDILSRGFAQIKGFQIPEAGRYRLRAVYDYRPENGSSKKSPAYPDSVLVTTPAIAIVIHQS